MSRARLLGRLGSALIGVGVGVGLFLPATNLFGYWQAQRAKAEYRESYPMKTAQRPEPFGVAPWEMLIPALSVAAVVQPGRDGASLHRGPAHYPSSARPGQRGNCVISGHRTTFGAPFRRLHLLTRGDLIWLRQGSKRRAYAVQTVKCISAEALTQLLGPTESERLTLVTCDPPLRAYRRLVVSASPVPGTP